MPQNTLNSKVPPSATPGATPAVSEQAANYTLTVQARIGPSAKEGGSLDLVELAHFVASELTSFGLQRIYTSTPEVPARNHYVLDFSVDTFQVVKDFFGGKLFAITELSITLRHMDSEQQALGKHVVRRRDEIFGWERPEKHQALYTAAGKLAGIVAQDIKHGEFGAALRTQPDQHEWEARLLDSQVSFIETNGHSAKWYRAAAKAHRKEILAKAAQTRREEAKRRLDAHALEEERQRIAAYARSRYRLEEATVVDMLRQHAEWEFRLLQEAIHPEEEKSDVQ
jgi:hypothetical protein